VDKLKGVSIGESDLTELQTILGQMKADVAQVTADAKKEYGSEITAVTSSIDGLSKSVQAARANPSKETLRPIASGVADVGSAVTALRKSVSSTC